MVDDAVTHVGGFHGPQVCGLVGISYRQLDYWARTGLLQPSVATAKGSGSRRVYAYSDVLELKVIKQLLDSGVSLQSARRAVECLREDLGSDLASANLVLTGTSSVLARSNGEVVDLLAGGQGVFNIVPLAGVVEELDADIVSLGAATEAVAEKARPTRVQVALGFGGVTPADPARVGRIHHPACVPAGQVRFAHPSERLFATLLDLSGERWEYEPVEFPLAWDSAGSPVAGFRPDFYLPGRGVFIELTTADQRLVTRKNRKMRRMRELYPEVPISIVYQRDFASLIASHGLLSGAA